MRWLLRPPQWTEATLKQRLIIVPPILSFKRGGQRLKTLRKMIKLIGLICEQQKTPPQVMSFAKKKVVAEKKNPKESNITMLVILPIKVFILKCYG